MDHLLHLIRHESAHSNLAFRARAYRNTEIGELVRDLVALANAPARGGRLLLLGVDDGEDGTRRFPGVSAGTVRKLQEVLPVLICRAIDPMFRVSVSAVRVDDKLIGAISLAECDNPPYLLRKDLSKSMRAGTGWIRRGTEIAPLRRGDIDEMYGRRTAANGTAAEQQPDDSRFFESPRTDAGADERGVIRIRFPGTPPAAETELDVLPLTELPSAIAASRIKKLIEAREQARALLGKTQTQIQRLVHAQLFDSDAVYEEHGDETLLGRLSRVKNDHLHADAHYEYETRTHRLQLIVENRSDGDLTDAALELKIPIIEGIGVSDTLYTETGESSPQAYTYPKITTEPHAIAIHYTVPSLTIGSVTPVFREPPRLWIREEAAGRTAELHYRLWAESLDEAVVGSLRIHVPRRASDSDTP